MTSCWDAMVIGIGSDHGDDRVGWLVTDQLEKHCPPRVKCLKVTMPIDLIEWLDAAQQIHVVDAATEMDVAVCRLRYEFEQHRRIDKADFNIGRLHRQWRNQRDRE